MARPFNRQLVLGRALGGLRNALMASGLSPADSLRFARLILTRPGVVVGPERIRYRGRRYTPEAFATSTLARYVTGRQAEARNRAAIEAEPGYMQTLAQLGLGRDLQTAGLDEQRRRAVFEFGDPAFAGADRLLGGQASANPFSTARLLAAANARQLAETRQGANRAGTLFGGGYQSGLQEAARVNAARQTEGTRGLQDLLASLGQQRSQAEQIYTVGRQGALQEAQQRLLASGALHAARAPALQARRYRLFNPYARRGKRTVVY